MSSFRYQRAICWLRRDLRLHDHRPLAEACGAAAEVIVVFIFDTTILESLPRDDRRVTFIHRSLEELDAKLRRLGSCLVVRHGDPVEEIPRLASELGAEAVHAGRDYEPAAKERDAHIERRLLEDGRTLHLHKDQVVFEGKEIVTGGGTPFKVFTPYRKAWMRELESGSGAASPIATWHPELERLAPAEAIERHLRRWDMTSLGFVERGTWLEPGEDAAARRLETFLDNGVDDYARLRDIPSANGTSGLSAHLRFGTISARELVRRARSRGGDGAATWLNELVWREFFQMILDRFPHVEGGAFRREYDAMAWPGTHAHFEAWCEGRTGYPIVDAAMRCFNATGWMHNRLRMVTASFLVKDLLVDWRWGEEYFARGLLDYDMAANNGNWQWAASTGCDAQPYFRVFNPTTQSIRFDPEGTFIRAHCPELRGFGGRSIHHPAAADPAEQRSAGCIIGRDYPEPIVDHAEQRQRAIALFRG